jgi:hypothetical protein
MEIKMNEEGLKKLKECYDKNNVKTIEEKLKFFEEMGYNLKEHEVMNFDHEIVTPKELLEDVEKCWIENEDWKNI